MFNEIKYIMPKETKDISKKQEYWNTGIALNKVDNLEPSKYLIELSQKNIYNELKYDEIEKLLKEYYEKQDSTNIKIRREKECDWVSVRIAELLEDEKFEFTPFMLKKIHRHLFEKIYNFAGSYREYNISKDEKILNGDTVKYVNYKNIENYFEYDFNEEKKFEYSKTNQNDFVKHIAKFTSNIWQIHPFGEGNTRTVAIFIEKYLNNMGVKVNNKVFENHIIYFRNALVRSNYGNLQKGITPTFEYLIKFFENFLYVKNNELNDTTLYIKELFNDKK